MLRIRKKIPIHTKCREDTLLFEPEVCVDLINMKKVRLVEE